MAAHGAERPVIPPGSQQLDWEVPHDYQAQALVPPKEKVYSDKQHPRSLDTGALELLNKIIPPHKRYLGLRRAYFLSVLVTAILLIVLAIGLGVGLTRSSGYVLFALSRCLRSLFSSSEDLPLPSNAKTFTGDLTYYSPALGACGTTSSDSDNICAVSHILFDASAKGSDPNANPLCGLKIRANRFNEQAKANRSVDLTVVDRCKKLPRRDTTGEEANG